MIKIREATEKDVEKIVELQVEFTTYSRGHDVFLQPSENYAEEQRKYTKNVFGKKNSIVYVAEVNGGVVGYLIGAVKTKPMFEISKRGHIYEVFVSRKQRGKGIGKALMEKFFERMKELGVEYVDLSVYVNNKEAIDFYNKFGFEEYKKYLRKKV